MAGSALSRVSTSQPSSRGSRMSSTTAAGLAVPGEREGLDAVVRAAAPARATPTGTPSSGRARPGRRRRAATVRWPSGSLGAAASTAGSGTRKPKVLPTPASGSSHRVPPKSDTIRRDSVSPSPVPSSLGAPRRPCWKDSKIRSRSAGSDPDAGVGHPDHDVHVLPRRLHLDPAPVGGELHGVRHQVEHHLLEAQLVGPHDPDLVGDVRSELDAVRRGALPDQRQDVVQAGTDGHQAGFEDHPAGLDLGQVEDLVEQLEQVPAPTSRCRGGTPPDGR